jgi:hypothetical protein
MLGKQDTKHAGRLLRGRIFIYFIIFYSQILQTTKHAKVGKCHGAPI